MSIRLDARRDSYDAVVVGSGIGGLTAAALLAHAGRRVLVVERHDRPGGYAHAFSRRRYRFDSAVHLVAGGPAAIAGPVGPLTHLLGLLGVSDRCEFRRLDPFYAAQYPGFRIEPPAGRDFLDAHIARFPAERQGLRRLHRLCVLVAREILRLPVDLPSDRLLEHDLPLLDRYRNVTVAEVFDAHLQDPKLKAVLGSLWPYLGVPPSRAAFDMWAPMLVNYLELGVYYCQGSFQRVADAIGAGLTAHGGELLCRTSVRRVLVDRGRVSGVVLDNGQRLTTPVVVSNADPLQTLEELVGAEHVAADYLTRLHRMRPSLSSAVLYLATDLDLAAAGVAHETFVFDHWDHDESYRRILAGEVPVLAVTVPTLSDPSLAPAGQHLVTVTALLRPDAVPSWRDGKPHYERLLREKLDQLIPGISRRTIFAEGGTPRTMERYTLNLAGAIYGWEHTPDQSTTDRLPHRTPVRGLYLSSHWSQPGGGVLAVLAAGIQTAEAITGRPPFAPAVPVGGRTPARTAGGGDA
jgi:prolycopene isomerase